MIMDWLYQYYRFASSVRNNQHFGTFSSTTFIKKPKVKDLRHKHKSELSSRLFFSILFDRQNKTPPPLLSFLIRISQPPPPFHSALPIPFVCPCFSSSSPSIRSRNSCRAIGTGSTWIPCGNWKFLRSRSRTVNLMRNEGRVKNKGNQIEIEPQTATHLLRSFSGGTPKRQSTRRTPLTTRSPYLCKHTSLLCNCSTRG